MNQSPHLTKDPFGWTILSYVILSALDVNDISCLQLWQGTAQISALYRRFTEQILCFITDLRYEHSLFYFKIILN